MFLRAGRIWCRGIANLLIECGRDSITKKDSGCDAN
jgi:hypothetical protein